MENTEKQLKIYFTSDVHGYLYPEDYADRSTKQLGLLAASAGFEKDGNTLLLDGGDMLQGSAFDLYCEKKRPEGAPQAEVMNAAGYDFVTVGNHDFNYGYDYLTDYLKALHAEIVCANLKLKRKEDAALVRPYRIVKLENGLRVAVIGIVTDYVNVWEQPANLSELTVSDPFEALKQAIEEIGDQADVRVCIYHGGYEADLQTGQILSRSGEDIGYRICRELPVDILLTGHQHMAFAGQWISGTFTAQAPDRARQYLELTVSFYGDGMQVRTALRTPSEQAVLALAELMRETPGESGLNEEKKAAGAAGGTQSVSVVRDGSAATAKKTVQKKEIPFRISEVAQKLLPIEACAQRWLDEPLGRLDRPLLPEEKIRMAADGSPIADLVNMIELSVSGADLACCGLANELGGFAKEVTTRNVIASYPFPNTLLVLEISGQKLKEALERTAAYFQPDPSAEGGLRVSDSFLKPKVEHYNYDYFAGDGFFYEIDASRPVGARIVRMTRFGKPIEAEEKLSICMNNYRASGAGGYEMYQGLCVLKEINTEMTELMVDFFGSRETVSVPKTRYYQVRRQK